MSFGLGTKRKGETKNWTISVPEDLAFRIDTLCVDPSTKKPVYGLRSQVITELLTKWAREREEHMSRAAKELTS